MDVQSESDVDKTTYRHLCRGSVNDKVKVNVDLYSALSWTHLL